MRQHDWTLFTGRIALLHIFVSSIRNNGGGGGLLAQPFTPVNTAPRFIVSTPRLADAGVAEDKWWPEMRNLAKDVISDLKRIFFEILSDQRPLCTPRPLGEIDPKCGRNTSSKRGDGDE